MAIVMTARPPAQVVEELITAIHVSGISVGVLASVSGVSQRHIYYVLGGTAHNVSAQIVAKLASAIGMRLALVRAKE